MPPSSQAINFAPDGNLTKYLKEINAYPMLTPDEELTLAYRFRDKKDTFAGHKIVTSHLRLVVKVAMGYRGYGFPVGELIGEGNVGMMQAVKRFDPDRGVRFVTYAQRFIRAEILDYIMHSWSLVKIGTTATQQRLFFNLRRVKSKIQARDDGDLTSEHVARIAHLLDVPEQEVVNMNRRLAAADHSLNAPRSLGDDEEWQDWLVENSDNQETVLIEEDESGGRKKLLREAMNTLTPREQLIITERRLRDEPTRMETLAQHLSITREGVRKIEIRAFEKLQQAMIKLVTDLRVEADARVMRSKILAMAD